MNLPLRSDARREHDETQAAVFHWVSRCMHVTEIQQSCWPLGTRIVNELENYLIKELSFLAHGGRLVETGGPRKSNSHKKGWGDDKFSLYRLKKWKQVRLMLPLEPYQSLYGLQTYNLS